MASVKPGHLGKAFLDNTGKPQIKDGFINTSEVVNEHCKQAAVLPPHEECPTTLTCMPLKTPWVCILYWAPQLYNMGALWFSFSYPAVCL